MNTKKRPAPLSLAAFALAACAVLAVPAAAQPADDYGDVDQTVARVAYFTGTVSYNRGDDPDDWQPAGLNFPMTLGDRIYTGSDSRLELQMGGATLYLAPRTDLAALNLTRQVRQLSIGEGLATFRIRSLPQDEAFEVDTPNSAVTFDGPGEYRIQVEADGTTRVSVSRGSALVAAAGGEVPVRAGDLMEVVGIDAPTYDVYRLPRRDSWDFWVESRARRFRDSRAVRYVSNDVFGADDLDEYGRWENVPEYGNCWSPNSVAADWAPYRVGHWVWQDPWGWTWVSTEPWGWAPYHWGRWVSSRSRWYWVPVGPSVRVATYSPALVAFVGAGGGFSASLSIGGGGYVGWFPLAPRDPFFPWWGARARVNVAPTFAFTHRARVTVVRQNVFVSGGFVGGALVRDANVVRGVVAAPILRGPLPILPTRDSLHVA
ncbi:MAG TPA: DUF6600 domain-containing protein, partial [Thermoanaerobaculia bacterium]|nr:DUF6600 domain-containing protein [Thermoanaerobaculia bacterium]